VFEEEPADSPVRTELARLRSSLEAAERQLAEAKRETDSLAQQLASRTRDLKEAEEQIAALTRLLADGREREATLKQALARERTVLRPPPAAADLRSLRAELEQLEAGAAQARAALLCAAEDRARLLAAELEELRRDNQSLAQQLRRQVAAPKAASGS
jgi:chromosome segregation ATPase